MLDDRIVCITVDIAWSGSDDQIGRDSATEHIQVDASGSSRGSQVLYPPMIEIKRVVVRGRRCRSGSDIDEIPNSLWS